MMTTIRGGQEVVLHIIIPLVENIKRALQATTIKIGETTTEETELLRREMPIREVQELTTPDAIAIRVILILSTKDHRRLIRRTRCLE